MITKQSLVGIISLLSVSTFAFGPTINPTIGGGALGGTNISVGFAGQATNGSGGSALIEKFHKGFVATGTRLNGNVAGANRQWGGRVQLLATSSITNCQVAFDNCGALGEAGNGGTTKLWASVEYPSNTFTQLKFSGATSVVIASGTNVLSDSASLTTPIPNGTPFWVRIFYTNNAGIYFTDRGPGGNPNNWSEFAASGLTDKTMGGSITANNEYTYYPSAVIGLTAKQSILLIGDSRIYGLNDAPVDTYSMSFGVSRLVDKYYGSANFGISGETFSDFFSSNSNRMQYVKYADAVYVELGINSPDANTTVNMSNFCTLFSVPVYASTIEPRTTSSDSWTTLSGQTVEANDQYRTSFNDNLRSNNVPGVAGYVDFASIVESSLDSGKWVANGIPNYFTSDGLHASKAGYKALAVSANTIVNPAIQVPTLIYRIEAPSSNDFVNAYGAIGASVSTNYLTRVVNGALTAYWTTNGLTIFSKQIAP